MGIESNLKNTYFKNLVAGNRLVCRDIVNGLLKNGYELSELYTELFQESLYEVGRQWQKNEISVATEHIATAITESLMTLAYEKLFTSPIRASKKSVLACIDSEHHQIGIKMVADVMEINGWETYFAGGGLPVRDLISLIEEKKPEVLGISVTMIDSLRKFKEVHSLIRDKWPELKIIVGGQALHQNSANGINPHPLTWKINNLTDLNDYLKKGTTFER